MFPSWINPGTAGRGAVFLGDGDHQPKVGFDHFLLGLMGLALALLHGLDDAAVAVISSPVSEASA
jgi:hypothetical protein